MKSDRRTLYTKHVIKEALSLLLNDTSLDKVTVKEICAEADINRATFYRHYKDIYDLFEQMEKDIINEVYEEDSLLVITPKLLQVIYEHQGFYKEFFKTHLSSPYIKNIMNKSFTELNTVAGHQDGENNKQLKFLHDYYIHGISGLMREWVDRGCDTPVDEIYEVIAGITKNEFGRFYKKP